MRQLNFLLRVLLPVLLWSGSLQFFAQSESLASLEVIDAQPSPAGRLALDEAITFTFNRRVDCADAEAALNWQPAIRGNLSCDEYSLTFEPSDRYQRDTNYTFSLTPPLQAKDGALLLYPFRVTFATTGYLQVAEVFPQPDSASVPVDSAITVVFDRPVVPLIASIDEDELPHPLVMSPATAGNGEWVNSAVYVFTPSEPLKSVTDYSVAVSAHLEAADGSVIESAFDWSFKTELPKIVSISPRPTSKELPLNPEIRVRFNQAMDRSAVEQAFYFRHNEGSEATRVAGEYRWAEDGKGFAFKPNEQLQYDSAYEAGFSFRTAIAHNLPGYRGISTSPQNVLWRYRTALRPAIEWFSPDDGATDVSGGGIRLRFASAMNIDTLRERIHIEPEPERISNDYYSYWEDRFDLYFKAQPSTEYTVRIEPGMEDIYGNAIAEPLTFSFTTGPLPPTMGLRVPDSVGFYNANRQPTQLYLTQRGVEKVDLEFHRVPTSELVAYLAGIARNDADDESASRRAPLRRWTIAGAMAENETQYDLLQLGAYGPSLSAEDEPLKPGIYHLKAEAPELDGWQRDDGHYLNVSNAVLTLKLTFDRLTIWAVDVDSGAPIVGERISVYNQLGEYEGGAFTDERGIAQLHIWYEPQILYIGLTAVLDTAEYFGIGNTRWSEGMGRWDANRLYRDNDSVIRSYLYTDRPVYRPGQPVYFRGIARSKDDVVYMPAPYETIEARLRSRETGKVVEKRVLDVSDFGTFSGKFDIAPDASLGRYYISIAYPNSRGEFRRDDDLVMFLVAEYRLPEYQVTLSTDEPEILQGDEATFELEGRYFFGGPVSDAAAEYSAYPAPYHFNYAGDGRYRFTDGRPYRVRRGIRSEKRIVAEGSLQTDDDGIARFDLVGDLGGEPGSQRWLVEASIRDEAGQTITANSDLVVHQGLLYIGAQPEKYVTRVGEDSVINIIAIDWDSQPIADQDIDVQVVERRWRRTQEQDLSTGRVKSTWNVEEIPVTSRAVRTGADGKARFVFQPPEGGGFNINVSTEDRLGNPASATARVWAWGSSYIRWGRDYDKSIDLIPARKDYRVGEIAQVLITSPFQDATQALVSIERGDVLSTEVITLRSNSHIYEFEILPEHAPNIYVGVFLLNPAGEDRPFADWRMGTAQLQVDPERYALHIEISAEPERASPREEVTFRLRVTDWKGDPVEAEVGVALTDLAALSLGERNSAALLETFFSPQYRGVHTSSSLVNNGDEHRAILVKSMGTLDPMNDMFDCCFGGGGGAFDAPSPLPEPRSEFVDTPYWNPSLVTDERGEATFKVVLPDNLTTWRLDARALTKSVDGHLLVGENSYDLISARPLLIRPVTPRFFTVGDRVQLSAVVNNNTGSEVNASISLLNTAGLAFANLSSITQRMEIAAGGRARATWTVTIEDVESVAPQFAVVSADGKYSDASISPVSQNEDGNLPVYRYEAAETVGTAGALLKGGARVEAVLLPRDTEVRSGSLDIRIEKSLAGVTNESLTYLERATRRHRECATTIVSRFLPNIVTYRALNELGLAKPELKAKLGELVSKGIFDLYALQAPEGGWSWCSYPKAHTLTTAYALIGLAEAKSLGYPVRDTVLSRALRLVRSRLAAPSLFLARWQLNRQAFLLYALAVSGSPDKARNTELYMQRARLNLDAVAFLAMALHSVNPDDERLETLAQMMLNRAVTRATGVFFEETYQDRWNWSSDVRSTALALNATLKIRPESELLPNIVRHLVTVRKGRGYWTSRQENVWSIIALTNWMRASGELDPDYSWSVSLNESAVSTGDASSENVLEADELRIDVADMIQRETNLIEFERDAGAGAFYYSAHLNLSLPIDDIAPFGRGLEISRSYTLLDDEKKTPIARAAIGETVQVRLRIVAPNTLRYVVIEDFFPAGAEAINPNLATSPQLGTIPRGDRIDARRQGWGWWYFDHVEFHDEKAVIYANYLPRGVYEFVYTLRPTIAGEFKVIPPVAQEMYFPEVYGRGAGALFAITEET